MTIASSIAVRRPQSLRLIGALTALAATPAVAIFLATNLANAGNLAFNMIFSRLLEPSQFHDLAVILTIKLGVLSVFGAVQMAVSQMVSRGEAQEPTISELPRLTVLGFILLFFAVPALLPVVLSENVALALGIEDHRLLAILLLSFPVSLPLSLARGAALGRVSVRGMVLSANLEMAVRLFGAVAAWMVGLGLPGIVAAIGVSLVVGWWPVRNEQRPAGAIDRKRGELRRLAARIAALSAPFAVLQLAQVGHLDADLLLSTKLLDADQADLMAGLSLVQRIQFYACFGLAGVLLPTMTRALVEGRSLIGPILPVAGLVLCTGAGLLGAALLMPEAVMTAVAGRDYVPATIALVPAICAAFCFTVSYITATLLAAIGDRSGIAIVALALPAFILVLWLASAHGGLGHLVWTKAMFQAALASCLILRFRYVLSRKPIAPAKDQ